MKAPANGKKLPMSARLSKEATILLARLARSLGLTKTGVLELAIREKAEARFEKQTTEQQTGN